MTLNSELSKFLADHFKVSVKHNSYLQSDCPHSELRLCPTFLPALLWHSPQASLFQPLSTNLHAAPNCSHYIYTWRILRNVCMYTMNGKGGNRRKSCNPTQAQTPFCKWDKHPLLKSNSMHHFIQNLNTKMAEVMDTGLGDGSRSSFLSGGFQTPVYGFFRALVST